MLTTDQIKNVGLNSQASTSPTMEVVDFPVSVPKFTKSAWDSGEGGGNAVKMEVADFPVSAPKFTKSAWDSGEGSGQGEG
jgi:hypothetical protein